MPDPELHHQQYTVRFSTPSMPFIQIPPDPPVPEEEEYPADEPEDEEPEEEYLEEDEEELASEEFGKDALKELEIILQIENPDVATLLRAKNLCSSIYHSLSRYTVPGLAAPFVKRRFALRASVDDVRGRLLFEHAILGATMGYCIGCRGYIFVENVFTTDSSLSPMVGAYYLSPEEYSIHRDIRDFYVVCNKHVPPGTKGMKCGVCLGTTEKEVTVKMYIAKAPSRCDRCSGLNLVGFTFNPIGRRGRDLLKKGPKF